MTMTSSASRLSVILVIFVLSIISFAQGLPNPTISPFGGGITIIDEQQTNTFVTTITGNPQSWYNLDDDKVSN